MKNKINSRNLKISLLFTAAGIVASAFAAMYQLDMFSDEIKNQIILQLGSTEALIAIAAVQGGIITLISSFAGLMLAEKVNLRLNFRFDKNSLMVAMAIGLLTAAVIVFSDRLIFVRYLPSEITNYEFSLLYLVTGILYGGIIEEILLRLFVMSFFVFVLWKLFSRGSDRKNIPGWIYISSILISAALFAAGHIPFTAQIIGLSLPVLARTFLLNGIGGIGFGYLYWKRGLAYSMCAHVFTHVFINLISVLFTLGR